MRSLIHFVKPYKLEEYWSSCSNLSTRSPEMYVNLLFTYFMNKKRKWSEKRTCVVNWRGQRKGLTSWTCPCRIWTSILSHRRRNTVPHRSSDDSGMSTASTNCSDGRSQLLQFGYRRDFYLQASISNSWAVTYSMSNISSCTWKSENNLIISKFKVNVSYRVKAYW